MKDNSECLHASCNMRQKITRLITNYDRTKNQNRQLKFVLYHKMCRKMLLTVYWNVPRWICHNHHELFIVLLPIDYSRIPCTI